MRCYYCPDNMWTNRKKLTPSHSLTTITCKFCPHPHIQNIQNQLSILPPNFICIFSFNQPGSMFWDFSLHPLPFYVPICSQSPILVLSSSGGLSIWPFLFIFTATVQIKGKMMQRGVEGAQVGHVEELQQWVEDTELSWLNVFIHPSGVFHGLHTIPSPVSLLTLHTPPPPAFSTPLNCLKSQV